MIHEDQIDPSLMPYALEIETHEAAHAVVALVLQATGGKSIPMGTHGPGPGAARVEFEEDMAKPDPERLVWNLARAIVMAAGEMSTRAVLGKATSEAHHRTTYSDTGMVCWLTEPWHRDSPEAWTHVGSDVAKLALAISTRHAEAIRAVADELSVEHVIDGPRLLELIQPHLDEVACELSREEVRALATQFERFA